VVDFRYHLVSIIAIFLALAVGIVVGTTALNGPVLDGLRRSNTKLIEEKQSLQTDVRELETDVATADGFAAGLAPMIVRGRLAGQRVLVVTTDRTPTQLVDQLTPLLTQAGGTVSGLLRLQPDLLDPRQGQLLEDLVAQVVPAGVEVPAGEPVDRAAAVLSAAVLRRPDAEPVAAPDAQAVVSAFEEAELVELSEEGEQISPADLVVLLTGAPPAGKPVDAEGEARTESLLALVDALDARSKGAVLAAPSAALGDGGAITAVRSNGALDARVSTVDNADRVVGQVAVVLALEEQAAGRAGRYGGGRGVQAPLPDTLPDTGAG
jgi:hypothetical protein